LCSLSILKYNSGGLAGKKDFSIMNICFLTIEYPREEVGGIGVLTQKFAKAIADLGHQVFVVASGRLNQEYLDGTVKVYRLKAKNNPILFLSRLLCGHSVKGLEFSWLAGKKVETLHRKYKFDIVVSPERFEGFWLSLKSHRTFPLIVMVHLPPSIVLEKLDAMPRTLDIIFQEKISQLNLLGADGVISVSRAVAELTSRDWKIDITKMPIIPNAVDLKQFTPGPNQDKKPVVFYAGRLELRKGPHILVKAAAQVLKEHPEVQFYLAGEECGMGNFLKKQIEKFSIQNQVHLLGRITNRKVLLDWYLRSSLCVVPSLWESSPSSCLEPMACGLPVIATDGGGFTEIIKNGEDGLLVSAGSHQQLAQAIIRLLENEPLREELGNNARKKVEEKFDIEKVAGTTISYYQEVIRNFRRENAG